MMPPVLMSGITPRRQEERPPAPVDYVRWLVGLVVPIALAALVSYFTAVGAITQRIERIDTREEEHFERLLEQLEYLRADVRAHLERQMVQCP